MITSIAISNNITQNMFNLLNYLKCDGNLWQLIKYYLNNSTYSRYFQVSIHNIVPLKSNSAHCITRVFRTSH